MKKIIAMLILMTGLVTGCDDKLDIVPKDFVNTDGLFENDANALINAPIAFYEAWYDRGRNPNYYAFFENMGTDVASVNLYNIDREPLLDAFNSYDNTLNPSFYPVERIWAFEYEIISIALPIIYYGSTSATIKDDPQVQKAVAEAKFFWSLAYYELIMTFGNVPLLTEPIRSFRDDFVRAPVEDIIPVIEQYLTEAIGVLDENTLSGRISKNACRMLLAKVYMAAAGDIYQTPGEVDESSPYWAKAEAMAEAVINSGVFSLIKERVGPYANDHDTVPGPVNWNVAAFPGMRDGLQQKYMIRHPNYFSSIFQNNFEGPEDENTEVIARISFRGDAEQYGLNYIRMMWVPYSSRANGLQRDFYIGARTWGRARASDYMAFDIWDYGDAERDKNWDARKYGSFFYHYYFNNESALKNHYLQVRAVNNPGVLVDRLNGWRPVNTASAATTTQGVTGKITVNKPIHWGKNGTTTYTADFLVAEEPVFVQPIITNYPVQDMSEKWSTPYTELWFPKRMYAVGDTVWGPRPGDEYYPRNQNDWQSVYVGCRKQQYWLRNLNGGAASSSEVSSYINGTGGPGDIILFRLAEAYLLAGEAEFHQGKSAEAAAHFNEVRKRAFNDGDVPVTWMVAPGDITIDWILDERARELFSEEYRWFEIKRLKQWDRVTKYNTFATANFDYTKHRLRPVPIREINLNQGNPQGMYQNKGYAGAE
jgi:hypothetical protein